MHLRKLLSHSLFIISICFFITGCIKRGSNPDDPYEEYNRRAYKNMKQLDKDFIKPWAQVYNKRVPWGIRKGVLNFFGNLNLLPTISNNILQGRFKQTIAMSWRLFINSTIGVVGILDPASTMGLEAEYNDLGVTLAKWGDRHPAYFITPVFGPSTIRDTYSKIFDGVLAQPYVYANSSIFTYSALALDLLSTRAELLEADKIADEAAIDEYVFVRDAYLQSRNARIATILGEESDPFVEDEGDSDDDDLFVEENKEIVKDSETESKDKSTTTESTTESTTGETSKASSKPSVIDKKPDTQ